MSMAEVSDIVGQYGRNFADRSGKLIRAITTEIEAGLARDGIPTCVASRVKMQESLRGRPEK